MPGRDVKVAFLGDVASLKRAIDSADRSMGDFERSVDTNSSKMSGSMARASASMSKAVAGMAAGAALAGGAIIAFGKQAFDEWSDLNEATSKTQVVFGSASDSVMAFANNSAKAFGMSKSQALEATSTFGYLFRAIGLTESKSAEMATSLTRLASDLASFSNTTTDEALTALGSGINGETEPLRRYGISLSEGRLKAEAFNLGLVNTKGSAADAQKAMIALEKAQLAHTEAVKRFGPNSLEARSAAADLAKKQEDIDKSASATIPTLDAAQREQAAYSIIMKDSALAQGDFSRTSSGAANQQRILSASVADAKAKFGEAFGPFLTETVIPNLIKVSDWFGNWWKDNGEDFKKGVDEVKTKFGEMKDSAKASTDDLYNGFAVVTAKWNEFTGQGSTNVNDTKAGMSDLSVNFNLMKQDWSNGLTELSNGWKDFSANMWNWTSDAWNALQTNLGNFGTWITDHVTGHINDLVSAFRTLVDLFDRVAPGTGSIIETVGKTLHLPGFDQGGVVPGRIGSPQMILAHGGETVLPTHKNPGMVSRTSNINVEGLSADQAMQLIVARERSQMAGAA